MMPLPDGRTWARATAADWVQDKGDLRKRHAARVPGSSERQVFGEGFSGARVPLAQGIYWIDVTKVPESGGSIRTSWKAGLARYKRNEWRLS